MLALRDIVIDAEIAALMPAQSDDERAILLAQVMRDGFLDPLIVWRHHCILLDGHNRFDIWQTAFQDDDDGDKEPSIVELDFKDRNSAIEWVIRNQLGRRNLTDAMRVKLALRLKPVLKERAKENQKQGCKNVDNPLRVDGEIARAAGVSHVTVRRAEAVLDRGSEAVKSDMLAGRKSITAAHREVADKAANHREWSITDDIKALTKVIQRLETNWTKPSDLKAMREFFEQCARDV